MSVVVFPYKSRWQSREWPRFREGAIADEHAWIKSLNDRELAELASELGRVDRAVREFRKADEKPNGGDDGS